MRAVGPLPGRRLRSNLPRGAIVSISSKIGCAAQTLKEGVKKVEVDRDERGGITSEQAEKLKALAREVRELKQANEILRKASAYFDPALIAASGDCRAAGRSSTAASNDDPVHTLPGSRNAVSMRGEDHRGDHGGEPICPTA
ncbi:MAG: hypothetical protein HEP69_05590 [Aestuariivita sp.]|nr:hypothetical protein [Aestuariivita sp.]